MRFTYKYLYGNVLILSKKEKKKRKLRLDSLTKFGFICF